MELVIGGVVLAVAVAAALLLGRGGAKGPSEEEIFRRFAALSGFTVTERHAHDGSGLAADETRGRVAVQVPGRDTLVLLSARDLAAWTYVRKDQVFEMTLKSRRHPEPFRISFRKSATADEWLKIFRQMVEEHG